MPEEPSSPAERPSLHFGVTEGIYLLGLILLGAGISMRFGIEWALIAIGLVLLFTAFRNAAERDKGTD